MFAIPFAVGLAAAGGAYALGMTSLLALTTAFTIGSTIASLFVGGSAKPDKPRPDKLNTATVTEARPVPVVWGTVRMPGNFLRYDKDTFRSREITEDGGWFQDDQVVGYKYYLTYDYGLCTGPVDRVTQVISNPGEEVAWEGEHNYSDGTPTSITLSAKKKGGTVDFYWGTNDQTRKAGTKYADDVANHRSICFIHFPNFQIGEQPTPSSFLFEIQRLPKVADDNGDAIAGFETRGSTDTEHPAYQEANPAALVFELFTNSDWGRGMSVAKIDVESFKTAAAYLAANHVGMSFAIGSQDAIEDTLEMVREHAQLFIFNKGEVLTCRALSDPATAYSPRILLTRDMLMDISFARPAWAGTVNEIRATFINRDENYGDEVVVAQDLASIQMAGAINSREVNLRGFGNRKTAEAQAYRVLAESAYPAATMTATLTRFHADIEPGAFVEFVIDDFTDGLPTTTYWRVMEINDDEQDPDGIGVTFHEDYYASAFEGTSDTFTPPVPSYEFRTGITDGDINLGDDFSSLADPGEISAFKIQELPISVTLGKAVAMLLIDAESEDLHMTDADTRVVGSTIWETLYEDRMPSAYGMELDADLPADGPAITRNGAVAFTVDNAWQRQAIEDATGHVKIDSDDFSRLTQTGEALLFIGNEIIQVGWAETTASGVEIRTMIRGCLGTAMEDHAAGTKGYFIEDIATGLNTLNISARPLNTPLEFQIERKSLRGNFGASALTPTATIGKRHLQPLPVEKARTAKSGSDWTIEVRPRIFTEQVSTQTIQDAFDKRTSETPYGVRVVVRDGSTEISNQNLGREYFTGATPGTGVTDYSWIPQNDTDAKSGVVKLEIEGVTSGRVVDIFTTDAAGNESSKPTTIE